MSKRIEGILAGIGRLLDEPEIPKENVNRRFSNSTGKNVEPLRTWQNALNSSTYEHCKTWTGP